MKCFVLLLDMLRGILSLHSPATVFSELLLASIVGVTEDFQEWFYDSNGVSRIMHSHWGKYTSMRTRLLIVVAFEVLICESKFVLKVRH